MKRSLFLAVCSLVVMNLHAQRTTDEIPYGLSNRSIDKIQVADMLQAPDLLHIIKEDSENDRMDTPLRFAVPVWVNYNPDNSGVWQQLDDGSKIWRLKVNIPGALGIITYYDRFWLPEGGKFWVYSEDSHQYIGAITSDFIESRKEMPIKFATAIIYGDNIVYEYYQPVESTELPVISINHINYGYRYIDNPFSNDSKNFGDAGSCQVNINCSEGDNWQLEKFAVTRIITTTYPSGPSYWASGALLNNTSNDLTPYVLTANHCLHGYDAMGYSDAGNWIFYWQYEHPGCSNSLTEPTIRSSTGATIVANNSVSDFALVKIKPLQDPKKISGVFPYYLGWDRSGNSGDPGVGIHHPRGDVKKIATVNTTPLSTHLANYNVNVNGFAWKVNWKSTVNGHSVPEGGSSGSPLININRRVIGQLYGGYTDCNYKNESSWYGKFSVSWTGNGATDNSSKLQPWLDTSNTYTVLNGISCPTIVNFIGTVTTPITVTTNTTIISCGDINVQYVKVQNGAKLILDAGDNVNFISDFEVELGSELEIK